jgi:hypothetical protein
MKRYYVDNWKKLLCLCLLNWKFMYSTTVSKKAKSNIRGNISRLKPAVHGEISKGASRLANCIFKWIYRLIYIIKLVVVLRSLLNFWLLKWLVQASNDWRWLIYLIGDPFFLAYIAHRWQYIYCARAPALIFIE